MKNETEMEYGEPVLEAETAERTHERRMDRVEDDISAEMSWSPGALLRRAREARKLSMEALSLQTKLPVRVLRALEVDDFDALSEPVYVRGYYRRCAHVLEVPSGEIVKAYERASGEPPPQPLPLKPAVGEEDLSSPPRWLPYVVFAVVAGGLVALLVWWGQPVTKNLLNAAPSSADHAAVAENGVDAGAFTAPEADVAAVSPSLDTTAVATTASLSLSDTSAAATPTTVHDVSDAAMPASAMPPAESETSAADVSAPADGAEPAVAANGNGTLTVKFTQKSWIRVTDASGERLLNGLVAGGSQRELSGEPPFDVLLGYAPGVDLSYDGKAIVLNDYIQSNNTAHLTVGGT